jgi:hypothetical protein
MINTSTHRRRASSRHGRDENGTPPSVFETLVTHLTDWVARSAIRRVKRGAREVVRWTVLRLVLGWVGGVVMTAGILLLLAAGLKGLETLHCPQWLAYLSTGVVAILIAALPLMGILRPKDAEAGD